jgi:hypothetical protein
MVAILALSGGVHGQVTRQNALIAGSAARRGNLMTDGWDGNQVNANHPPALFLFKT